MHLARAERNRHLGGRQTVSATCNQVDLATRSIHAHNGHGADVLLDVLVWFRSVDYTCPIRRVAVMDEDWSGARQHIVRVPRQGLAGSPI